MAFEFHTGKDITSPLVDEIVDFLDAQNTSHLFQFPQWNTTEGRYALLREEGRVRWFVSFGVHSPLGSTVKLMRAAVATRGPVCDDRKLWLDATAQFAEQLRREGFVYLDASPDWTRSSVEDKVQEFGHSSWERLSGERVSLRLDLTREEDEIFANLRKNSRYEIRRAERLGVSVKAASSAGEIEEFLALHSGLAARKGFTGDDPADLRRSIQWLMNAEGRGALLLARSENRPYGGAVIGRAGKRCWYVWGAADKHENFNVGHLIQWRALLWAKSHDCTDYDFGGYTAGATSGPAWFKAGFGGAVVRFVPAQRKILRLGRYRVLNIAFQMRELSRVPRRVAWPRNNSLPHSATPTFVEK